MPLAIRHSGTGEWQEQGDVLTVGAMRRFVQDADEGKVPDTATMAIALVGGLVKVQAVWGLSLSGRVDVRA